MVEIRLTGPLGEHTTSFQECPPVGGTFEVYWPYPSGFYRRAMRCDKAVETSPEAFLIHYSLLKGQ